MVYHPRFGVIAALMAPAAAGDGAALEVEVDKIASEFAEMIDFDLTPAPVAAAEEAKAEAGWVEALRKSAMAETDAHRDINLSYADEIEIAMFSSGLLEIYSMDQTISIAAPVLTKLRRFLGLFAEEA